MTTVLVKCGKLRVSVFFVLKNSKFVCNYIIQCTNVFCYFMTMWFKLSAIYSISLKICNSMFFYMRSPVTFLQEIYLSSMTGNFNWIYDSVFPRNKPCWTFFLGIYGKLDVLYAGIVAENACAENKNRSVSCHAYLFAKWCRGWT